MTQPTTKPEATLPLDAPAPTTDSVKDQEDVMFEEFDLDDIEIIESKVFA